LITIDYRDRRPIYQQIIERLENLVAQGILQPESRLPSVRQLAMDLSINPNTIVRAYMELEKRGVIYSIPGKGSFVSPQTAEVINQQKERIYRELAELGQKAIAAGITQQAFTEAAGRLYRQQKGGSAND